ncbi:hypothetical protein OAL86_04780 [Verrucomicrobia bacterium]|nr:hypothetical protein [Verrucomicrobiota bacterium]MDC0295782.1 hypothetical protein [bacterium]MDG1855878.1 hypothetical protein [Verrucomicrobiota bacterium]
MEFLDGSYLHGDIQHLSAENGLDWQHPLAANPMRFNLDNLSRLRLNASNSIASEVQPECRFEFVNGDLIYGNLQRLSREEVSLKTWFGGEMKTSRAALRRIAFLKSGYKVIYEGPNGIDDWMLGQGQNGWTYADGKLRIKNRGVLGRNFQLKDSCNLSFDLEWDQPFQLSITMFTDTLNRFDYRQGSYIFFLSPQFVSFQRVQPGTGVLTLGQVRMDQLSNVSKARFSIRAHRETSKFAVYINDQLVSTFRDNRGFVAEGKGISLASQLSASSFAVSDMLVTEWDGTDESDLSFEATESSDVLHLINQDKPKGDVVQILDQKIHFKLRKERDIRIPLERIKQIHFTAEDQEKPPAEKSTDRIRAHFAGGGSLSFDLVSLNGKNLQGNSEHFGELSFTSSAIRQIEFNLNHQSRKNDQAADTYWNMENQP